MSQVGSEIDHENAGRMPRTPSGFAEASVMLDLFEGLGVRSFSFTLIDEAGHKIRFTPHRPVSALRAELTGLLLACYQKRLNLIVRPLAARALSLIQLDDLTPSQLDRVRGFAFLVLETSPENFQAWVAVKDARADTMRRIKTAAGADLNASGATRIAGSHNFKSKYAPDYPRVRLQSIAPRRTVTVDELDRAGLVAAEEPTPDARAMLLYFGVGFGYKSGRATRAVWLTRPAQKITTARTAAQPTSNSALSVLIEDGLSKPRPTN